MKGPSIMNRTVRTLGTLGTLGTLFLGGSLIAQAGIRAIAFTSTDLL